MDFEKVEKTFKNYVDKFDWDNENIRLKYYHTLEVANISYEIAKLMNLNDEEKDLAKLIGYLHDIGRFEQIKETNSFKDKNIDHADNGVEILFREGLIKKFIDTNKYDEIIRKAVRNHNKLEILDPVNKREELFANIIRDSDKIDIFRVRTLYYDDKIELLPSKEVLDCFDAETPVKLSDIKNKSDSILCVLAFIFDFNYKESLKILKEKGYYEQLINKIKVKEEHKELFNKVKQKTLRKLEV